MSGLDPRDTRRLASTLEMMTSPSDGEKLAAIAAVSRILDKHGLRFGDLALRVGATHRPGGQDRNGATGPSTRAGPVPVDLGKRHQAIARMLLHSGRRWTSWEHRFLDSLTRREAASHKERAKLDELRAAFRGSVR